MKKISIFFVLLLLCFGNYLFSSDTIVITSPADLTDTSTQTITISGTFKNASSGDTIILRTNATTQTTINVAADSGNWSGTVTLSDTEDSVSATIQIDAFYSGDSITLNYFGTPDISITSPDNLTETSTKTISISGTTSNSNVGDIVYIFNYISGKYYKQSSYTLTAVEGEWSGTTTLTGISDSIVVRLYDSFSRNAYDTSTFHYIIGNNVMPAKKLNQADAINSVINDYLESSTQNIYKVFLNKILGIVDSRTFDYPSTQIFTYNAEGNVETIFTDNDVFSCTETFVYTTVGSDSKLQSITPETTWK